MLKFLLLFLLSFLPLFSDGCLKCHQNTTPIDDFHPYSEFGCSSCHLGVPNATTKALAHEGLLLNPSSLTHSKIVCKKCHEDIINRVEKSIMNTQSGIIDVLRFQFKETKSIKQSNGIEDIRDIPTSKQTLAQSHFSKLCAACHIDQDERIFKNYEPRGGGCVDCHRVSKAKWQKNRLIHPKLTTKIPSKNCLKCHNRSNRIGLSYFGKFESEGYGTPYKNGKLNNKIDKGRYFYTLPPDIHHKNAKL